MEALMGRELFLGQDGETVWVSGRGSGFPRIVLAPSFCTDLGLGDLQAEAMLPDSL